MTTEADRRIRPWIAAVLTLLGWGLGFFYARQTRAALVWAATGAFAALLILAVVAWIGEAGAGPMPLNVHLLPWLATAVIAVLAWRAAARAEFVERGSPTRLLGYLAVWLIPILILLIVRFVGVQPFRHPSGSMQPTLQVGEYLFVAKWSYGYSRYSFAPLQDLLPHGRMFTQQPQRGDLVVFRPAHEPGRDFVKRLVGMPGDRIQMIGGVLHINGVAVERESLGALDFRDGEGSIDRVQAFRETLPNGVSYVTFDRYDGELDNTREFVAPDGHYFMMGDDRDNSDDSRRSMGFVPFDNFVGRVAIVAGVPNQ